MNTEEYQDYFRKHFTKTWPSLVVMKNLPLSAEMHEWIDENCDESMCIEITDQEYLYCFKTDSDSVISSLP